jgi:AraC-like DNA-binding protein
MYDIRDSGRGADKPDISFDASADADAAATARLLVLRRRARLRIRTDKGAVVYALGSGLLLETATFKAWVQRGDACVVEANQQVEIVLPERLGSMALVIVPDGRRLDHAALLARGERASRTVLFPQTRWPLPPDLAPSDAAVETWWLDAEAAADLCIWADRMLTACVDQQMDFESMVKRCSGRNWAQKQAMLCRLLRARIAMQQADSLRVADGARAALLSTSGFIAQYRDVFGETPVKSAYGDRLEEALLQLTDGDRAVRDVAEHVGYGNRCSFSRAFKSRFGFSPKDANSRVETRPVGGRLPGG